jgi:hypothetical protein
MAAKNRVFVHINVPIGEGNDDGRNGTDRVVMKLCEEVDKKKVTTRGI